VGVAADAGATLRNTSAHPIKHADVLVIIRFDFCLLFNIVSSDLSLGLTSLFVATPEKMLALQCFALNGTRTNDRTAAYGKLFWIVISSTVRMIPAEKTPAGRKDFRRS
jgi:hypothetical protein